MTIWFAPIVVAGLWFVVAASLNMMIWRWETRDWKELLFGSLIWIGMGYVLILIFRYPGLRRPWIISLVFQFAFHFSSSTRWGAFVSA
jgi:hypothetical protein